MRENAIRVGRWVFRMLGLNRNSKYTYNYLNEANLRSAIYMGFVMAGLEVWMIIRSLVQKGGLVEQFKKTGGGFGGFMTLLFDNTSYFWLMLIVGVSMMVFCILFFRTKKKRSRAAFITTLALGAVCVLYSFLVFFEKPLQKAATSTFATVRQVTIIVLYAALFLYGMLIILHGIIKWTKSTHSDITAILLIIMFAVMCLSFGIKVSYSDFFSNREPKMILCFVMMVMYVACLLIWKPYISILMQGGIFALFYNMLNNPSVGRVFVNGDKVNYITFFISLVMVSISIYHQRLSEASKDEELERRAREDDLTGINNYRHFLDVAREKLGESDNCDNVVFLFFNIAHFKSYNDKFGFQAGNQVLIDFAGGLQEAFSTCPVARYGDDRFVAMAHADTYEAGIARATAVLERLNGGLFMELKVGGYRPLDRAEDPRHAIDRARYACGVIGKKTGETYLEFTRDMAGIYEKRQYIINNIDTAIKEGYVRVYYQPVVWSSDGTLCGCEALARWIDPQYGFLSPGDFIPVLEELRLIDKLDRAIFEIVCRDIHEALEKGEPCVPISINFSRLDFELMDAVGVFEKLVERYEVPKQYVHVEVTESALTDDMSKLHDSVEKLHNDGFAIWLDDFGSGYSSLNVLKSYSFDLLKIDMNFLKNFSQYPKTKDILLTIVELAGRMGMKTLTEGVETTEQSDYLKSIGCGRLQGYLYGKPIALETLKTAIAEGKYVVSNEII